MVRNYSNHNFLLFQVWRPAPLHSRIYTKIGEIQVLNDQVTGYNNSDREANIIFTGEDTIEVESGDVVGYYQPPDARYRVRTRKNEGYRMYEFYGSSIPTSVDLSNANHNNYYRQPLVRFTIGKH